ncbi:hypothetical protein [Streptomyces phaeochromogenes]|uniref:hypothetical protein n=1 Tax=Streptomyces phaeochromogenes TaxID=1923 RepID=UPI002DD7FFD1|nr:hypothetical protein [Streptomyces phaeochromogenes]WRZ30229.1 hypothetical protein OG931_21990 [Streptomyces phaeochromogenes]
MNLIELALTTYTESKAERSEEADYHAEQARTEFLGHARSSAGTNLCKDAADLDWQYVTEGLPDQMEEARALLVPGRREYLRYRIDNGPGTVAFELVQPCTACRNDRVSPVTGLFHLGQLLTEDDGPHPATGGDQEPGPLAAIEQASAHAARVARLARHLIAEHPDAGLAVQHVSLFGHEHGDGRAEIHFNAGGLDALRRVAAALGAEVTVRVSGGSPAFVLEHGSATGTVDDIDVELRAYSQMSDDEAAAWRAQQDQPADGGEGE